MKEYVNEEELSKINKGVCRWKSLTDPNVKLQMKALDHWIMIIKFRKLMRHWLIFSNNRVQWVKADMQEAFGKWRMGDIKLGESFNSKPREFLIVRNLKQSNTLMTLA
jgi:long-subunit acyl-CoA synthetase (AMP-forming)